MSTMSRRLISPDEGEQESEERLDAIGTQARRTGLAESRSDEEIVATFEMSLGHTNRRAAA
ncbi:hypothetical protein BFN03_06995 [Rhodococcus sp. WMMA185]|nr:hypothetical protein BFN03_06995 [Rhodococcus sp. WMMA185]